MTYSVSNPPRMILDGGIPGVGASTGLIGSSLAAPLKGGSNIWLYQSTHSSSEIVAAAFFTYADSLRMKVGDTLFNQPQTTNSSSKMTLHPVTNMTSATTGVAGSTFGARYDATVGSAT